MPKSETATLLRNLDHRVAVIEQILPTLATKDDLQRFTTKDELQVELQRFATKDDLQKELQRFATKEDLHEEGDRSRRYMKVLVEAVHDTVNRALDVQMSHTQRIEEHGARLDAHDGKIDGLWQGGGSENRAFG